MPHSGAITEPGIYDMPDEVRPVPVGRNHFALVDAADFDALSQHRWHLLRGHNGKLYAYTGSVYMHRILAETALGYETDHVNGNGLDNRRVNLRQATPSQNRANMGKPARPDGGPHTSTFKGVSWDRSRLKWQAKIHVAGRHKNLGRYHSEHEAARAYDIAAFAAWGEFARLNLAVAS